MKQKRIYINRVLVTVENVLPAKKSFLDQLTRRKNQGKLYKCFIKVTERIFIEENLILNTGLNKK